MEAGPVGGHARAVGHRPGIGVQTRVRRAASAAAAGAVPHHRPPRQAGLGAAGRARPGCGSRCRRPAAGRGRRPDPAIGSVRTVTGSGGRGRRTLAGPQLARRPGVRRQPPGRRTSRGARGCPGPGPAASYRWAAEPLPLTDRLRAVISSRFAALPGWTQAALLLAAVADGPELTATLLFEFGAPLSYLSPPHGYVVQSRIGYRPAF